MVVWPYTQKSTPFYLFNRHPPLLPHPPRQLVQQLQATFGFSADPQSAINLFSKPPLISRRAQISSEMVPTRSLLCRVNAPVFHDDVGHNEERLRLQESTSTFNAMWEVNCKIGPYRGISHTKLTKSREWPNGSRDGPGKIVILKLKKHEAC